MKKCNFVRINEISKIIQTYEQTLKPYTQVNIYIHMCMYTCACTVWCVELKTLTRNDFLKLFGDFMHLLFDLLFKFIKVIKIY